MIINIAKVDSGLGMRGPGGFGLCRAMQRPRMARRVAARVVLAAGVVMVVLVASVGTALARASGPHVSASFVAVGHDISVAGTVSAGSWGRNRPRSQWIAALQQRVGAHWLLRASGRLHAHGDLSDFSLTWMTGTLHGRREMVRVEIISGKRVVAMSAGQTVVAPAPASGQGALRSSTVQSPSSRGVSASGGSGGSDAVGSPDAEVPTSESFDAKQVTSGGQNACILLRNGDVDCWGSDLDGVLGIDKTWPTPSVGPTTEFSDAPGPVARISEVTQVSAGYFYVCALNVTGTVYCWGWDGEGELGNGEFIPYGGVLQPENLEHPIPTEVPGLAGVRQVATGAEQACALLNTGKIECWGSNSKGQLGVGTESGPDTCDDNGSVPCSTRPVTVSGITHATEVASGELTTCALLAGGSVDCWGLNRYGNLGDGTTTNSDVPVAVPGITDATKIAVGGEDACALLAGGSIDCWGLNEGGQLGDGIGSGPETCLEKQMCSTRPVPVSGIDNAVQISVASSLGSGHACALLATETVKCWGNGDALGDESYASSDVPVEVSGLSGVLGITTNSDFSDDLSCAALSDGALDCWGSVLGTDSDVPVDVPIPEAIPAPE